jgi:hypothetical protein
MLRIKQATLTWRRIQHLEWRSKRYAHALIDQHYPSCDGVVTTQAHLLDDDGKLTGDFVDIEKVEVWLRTIHIITAGTITPLFVSYGSTF